MIILKTARELALMKRAGEIAAGALNKAGEAVRPGVTTLEIDAIVKEYILSQGAKPSFLGYDGYPASACISVNEEVIHGIPSSKRILREGDIVGIDIGACKNGYHGDTAATFPVGKIDDKAAALLKVTRQSLERGIAAAVAGNHIGDIGYAIQSYAESNGFSVVRDFVGHGVGSQLHEEPEVRNYGKAGHGPKLVPGMTIAIEPMINMGVYDVEVLDDDWTVVTADGLPSAHFEHSVAITESGPLILTSVRG